MLILTAVLTGGGVDSREKEREKKLRLTAVLTGVGLDSRERKRTKCLY